MSYGQYYANIGSNINNTIAILIAVILLSVPALAGDLVAKKHTDKAPTAKSAEKEANDQAKKDGIDPNAGHGAVAEPSSTGQPVSSNNPTPPKEEGPPQIWCPPGSKPIHGVCHQDIFVTVHKKVKTNNVVTNITSTKIHNRHTSRLQRSSGNTSIFQPAVYNKLQPVIWYEHSGRYKVND